MFKVICPFTDLQDNRHVYSVGDVYPRHGAQPTMDRISELLGENNARHKPLIEGSMDAAVVSETETKTPPRRKRGKKNENS